MHVQLYLMNTATEGLLIIRDVPDKIIISKDVLTIVNDIRHATSKYALPISLKVLHAVTTELKRAILLPDKFHTPKEILTPQEVSRVEDALDVIDELFEFYPFS